jgi:hypothetical protein
MTYPLKPLLLASAIAAACAPTLAWAQSSTSPGTTTPATDCTDMTDPNCKPNQNQKEQTNDAADPNQQDDLNNPASQTQVDPAADSNDQTPGTTGSPENASGGDALNPAGSEGSVEGDNAGGAGSAGSSGANN